MCNFLEWQSLIWIRIFLYKFFHRGIKMWAHDSDTMAGLYKQEFYLNVWWVFAAGIKVNYSTKECIYGSNSCSVILYRWIRKMPSVFIFLCVVKMTIDVAGGFVQMSSIIKWKLCRETTRLISFMGHCYPCKLTICFVILLLCFVILFHIIDDM